MGGAVSTNLPRLLDEATIRKLAGPDFDEDAWKLCEKDVNGNVTREQFLAYTQYLSADLDKGYADGPSMCEAAAAGRVRTIQLQLENDEKDPNVSHSNYAGKTPMTTAAFQGHADAVKYLCFKGANVNIASDSGETPAHAAAENNQPDALRFCIDAHADLSIQDCRGFTPLHIAAQMASYECLHLLVEVDAPLNAQALHTDYCTPLSLAAREGQLESIRILVKGGADVDAPADRGGVTAAGVAARHGQCAALSELFKLGANACQGGHTNGSTPCHEAARWGQETALSIVLEAARKQANRGDRRARNAVNLGDALGFTPFYYAAESGQEQTAMMLIINGADINKASNDGSTPEVIAVANNNQNILKLMRERADSLAAAGKEKWDVALYSLLELSRLWPT
eukprot:g3977.t1